MNRMEQRTNGRICKQWRPERSFVKRRCSERTSQEPERASFVERVRKAGSCSSVGERAVAALGSPPDGFPVLSQVGPTLVRRVPPNPTLPSLTGKPTVDSCGLSTRMRVHVARDACTSGVPGNGNPPHFCLDCRWRAFAHSRSVLLAAFSRSLSRCTPLSSHPPELCLWCADGSSRPRRTSSVLSLHRQRRPAEQESRQQSRELHAAGSTGWKRRPSQRSRPWPGSIRLGGPARPQRASRLVASRCFHP
jgi:hypothetical protein